MSLNEIEIQPGIVEKMIIPEDFRMAGWVYVLSNEFMPGIYKVGMTTTSPANRAKELSSATGVPIPFKIEAAFHSTNPAASESAIHQALSKFRVNESREFFRCDLNSITYECHCYCEARVKHDVSELANEYDVNSFETLHKLDVAPLFDEIGISVFGSKLAVAERLIRLGAERVSSTSHSKHISLVLYDDKAYAIESSESKLFRFLEEERLNHEAELIKAGIYGPRQPVDI